MITYNIKIDYKGRTLPFSVSSEEIKFIGSKDDLVYWASNYVKYIAEPEQDEERQEWVKAVKQLGAGYNVIRWWFMKQMGFQIKKILEY